MNCGGVWWNCVIRGNTVRGTSYAQRNATGNIYSVSGLQSADHSFWRNGTAPTKTTDCIYGSDKDPRFVGMKMTETLRLDLPVTAFALRASSPCRDAGVTLAGQKEGTDLAGKPRVKYAAVDMGALEFNGPLGSTLLVR